MQVSMKYFFFDRLKFKQEESNKYYKNYYFIQFINNFFRSFASAFLALIFTYPLDLAYTRKAGKLIPDGNYETYRSCFHTKIDNMIYYDIPVTKMLESQKEKNQLLVSKYYEKVSFALMLSTMTCFTNMIGFAFIRDKIESNNRENKQYSIENFFKLLGMTTTLTILTSPIIYPFDTMLKQMQVNGARGYNLKYSNNNEGIKQFMAAKNTFYK